MAFDVSLMAPALIERTRPLIREAALKLDERTGKVGHGGCPNDGVRYSFYAVTTPPEPEGYAFNNLAAR